MIVCSFFLEGISVFVGRNLVTGLLGNKAGLGNFPTCSLQLLRTVSLVRPQKDASLLPTHVEVRHKYGGMRPSVGLEVNFRKSPAPMWKIGLFIVRCDHLQQGLSQQGVQVSFWHPGPRKTPILGGKDTLSLDQKFLKILIISRYLKKFYS